MEKYIYGCMVLFSICLWKYADYRDENHPLVCVQEAKVEIILSLHGRKANLLLDNGTTYMVDQASLRPGDTICLKKERK